MEFIDENDTDNPFTQLTKQARKIAKEEIDIFKEKQEELKRLENTADINPLFIQNIKEELATEQARRLWNLNTFRRPHQRHTLPVLENIWLSEVENSDPTLWALRDVYGGSKIQKSKKKPKRKTKRKTKRKIKKKTKRKTKRKIKNKKRRSIRSRNTKRKTRKTRLF